jgi:hypothetical protein
MTNLVPSSNQIYVSRINIKGLVGVPSLDACFVVDVKGNEKLLSSELHPLQKQLAYKNQQLHFLELLPRLI